jgi:hypothetical protein
VGAVILVIGNVVAQQAKQVAVVEDDDVVEKLAADAADQMWITANQAANGRIRIAPKINAGSLGEVLRAAAQFLPGSSYFATLFTVPVPFTQ